MPSLNDVKLKIAGVGKTKQITKAMNMVASAKLRGAQTRIERFRPYADKFREVLGDVASKADGAAHPLLAAREQRSAVAIVLLTSDRGLCGAFNAMLIARALDIAGKHAREGRKVSFVCVGRKGRDAIRKSGYEILSARTDVGTADFALASSIGKELIHAYASQQVDEVELVYGRFVSISKQVTTVAPVLPVAPDPVAPASPASEEKAPVEDAASGADSATQAAARQEYLYEPEVARLLAELLPRSVNVQIYRALLDTAASENAARMAAMDNATRNCDELASALTLLYNKTRQASITNELIDIVGGAEALQ